MGIPSYYKKLTDHIQGLVTKQIEGKPSCLYFDFNCMIYHCARRSNSTLPPYPGHDQKEEWEDLLLEDIVKYIVKIWHDLGQPEEVFLAIDGVVPMAKIKQQRLRRFKSVWLAEEEKKEGIRDNVPSWDTNCITPGTAFMRKLTRKLQALCAKHKHWSVSGAEEPGEGEHKVMAKLRAREKSEDPVIIYGLDADLILLTMLNAKSPAYLVREDSEMGVLQFNTFGEEQFSYFSLDVLKQTIPPEISIVEYVTGMTLLGNDFLPHSLTMKMREDGHARLVKTLALLKQAGRSLIQENQSLLDVNYDTVWSLMKLWEQEEESRMLHILKKKLQMRSRVEQNLDSRPLQWMVEQGLVGKEGDTWTIQPQWRGTYRKDWLQCDRQSDIYKVCREYLFGLQWVVDYYTGQRVVNLRWCFSRLVPPLWCDIANYLERDQYEPFIFTESLPIQPSEQLAMVLPLDSWHFLEDASLRSLPSLLPQFWPQQFGFFSAGRIRMWECEPLLPILTVERLQSAVEK